MYGIFFNFNSKYYSMFAIIFELYLENIIEFYWQTGSKVCKLILTQFCSSDKKVWLYRLKIYNVGI
jgi:hypothetical protein